MGVRRAKTPGSAGSSTAGPPTKAAPASWWSWSGKGFCRRSQGNLIGRRDHREPLSPTLARRTESDALEAVLGSERTKQGQATLEHIFLANAVGNPDVKAGVAAVRSALDGRDQKAGESATVKAYVTSGLT